MFYFPKILGFADANFVTDFNSSNSSMSKIVDAHQQSSSAKYRRICLLVPKPAS
jgi:hypothetical protein